jgi:hypothetical protein
MCQVHVILLASSILIYSFSRCMPILSASQPFHDYIIGKQLMWLEVCLIKFIFLCLCAMITVVCSIPVSFHA